MISKSVVKFIHSLGSIKFRKIHRAFTAEGTKTVADLLQSDLTVLSVYATPEWLEKYRKHLEKVNDRCFIVNEREMKSISSLTTPQEVLAVVALPDYTLQPDQLSDEMILMLDEIRDPGNLGTIIRTADWFGIRHILCSPGCVDVFNPKVVQASMGSIARVHVHYINLEDFLRKQNPFLPVYGFMMEGQDIRQVNRPKNAILLFGNESTGISPHLVPLIQFRITIPSYLISDAPAVHSIDSLNVAQACSIACFAFRR